jgi:hypothetical protein
LPVNKACLSSLAFVGLYVNSAIASGHGDAVSFDEIYTSLKNGTLLEVLDKKLPGYFDFSLFPAGSKKSIALNHSLHAIASGIQGRERRKVGVETSGLHLVLALIFEAIQH